MASQIPPNDQEDGQSRLMHLVRLACDALLEAPRSQVPGAPAMSMRQLSQALRREALPAIEELEALQASVVGINEVLANDVSLQGATGQQGATLEVCIQMLQDELARVRMTFDPDAPLRTYGLEPLSHIKELAREVQDITGVICGGHPRKVGALMLIAAAVPDLVERIEEFELSRMS